MTSARAVTNSIGNIASVMDSKVEDVHGTYKLPDVINWNIGKSVCIGDIYSDDGWSLLVDFITLHHEGDTGQRKMCTAYTSSIHARKIDIDGFEYIERKKKITRRVLST